MNTTKTAHTPGPWSAVPYKGTLCIESDSDSLTIATVEVVHSVRDPKEQAANARLIASAPDLLAALRLAIGNFEFTPSRVSITAEAFHAMKAAILSAEGGKERVKFIDYAYPSSPRAVEFWGKAQGKKLGCWVVKTSERNFENQKVFSVHADEGQAKHSAGLMPEAWMKEAGK